MSVISTLRQAQASRAAAFRTIKAPPLPPAGTVTDVSVPSPHKLPVGGRLEHFTEAWTSLPGATQWHKQAMQGIPLAFQDDQRPPENRPYDSAARLPPRSAELEACSATLQHYLEAAAVEELPADTEGGLWSTFFPVAKKNTTKMRGCLDLRPLNRHLRYEHFKMEGLHTVRDLLRRRDYMAKVDLSDYFFHLPIKPEDRQYFRFMWQGKKYQCTAMPFGLAPAPRLATKILQPVVRHLRSMGVRLVVYIDDILVLARSQDECLRHTQLLVDTLHHFGFGVHPDKIQAVPTRSIEFLGIQVNSALMQFRVPRHKIRDLRREIALVRSRHEAGELTLRHYSSLIGKFNAIRGAVSSAPLHIWPLLHLQTSVLRRRGGWDSQMSLSLRVLEELSWWHDEMVQWSGLSFIPVKHSHVLTTDASSHGWGGWWRRVGQKPRREDEARGFFLHRESRMSSNSRELHAVLYSTMAAAPRLKNSVVLVETDNSTTMAYVNHLGGRSRFLSEVAHRLWRVTNQFGITLRAVHRPGVENRRADLLSRWKQDSTDLKLDPKYFRLAEQRWGRHTVDLFATRLNRQVGRFVSWRPDPEATAVDAFQFPLIGENPWCFPPEALIPRLLGQLTRQRATVTLVAPQWPGKPWWPDLIRMMVDKPIKLPNHHSTLQAIGTNEFSGFPHWNLAIFRISGAPSTLAAARRL